MKAVVLVNTGDTNDISKNLLVKDSPLPEINDDEVLIEIKSASLNHRDLWIVKGMYSKINLPVILGSDGAGVIHTKGKNVNDFNIGDEVLINPGMNWGNDEGYQSKNFSILGMPDNGTLAQYIKINQTYVFKKPVHLDFIESSALPLAGVTAFRSVFTKANVTKDDSVLVTGIGGGVATFAILFAISAGAKVFVTSGSKEKIEKAKSLGAIDGADYNSKDWEKKIIELSENTISVVIDSAAGENYSKFPDICNYGGRIVSYGATFGNAKEFSVHKLYWKQLKIFGTTMGSQKDFAEMLKYIEKKKIKPVIDEVFPLEDIHNAFRRMDKSEQFGKIVITM